MKTKERTRWEGPILMSGPMVLSLMADLKLESRRLNLDWLKVKAGDRLWVQEGYRLSGFHQEQEGEDADRVATPLVTCHYLADQALRQVRLVPREAKLLSKRKDRSKALPGRFMYRSCSRITLEATADARLERLQDISKASAIAEGIEEWTERPLIDRAYRIYDNPYHGTIYPVYSYRTLWDSLHPDTPWSSNPEVVVLTFRRIEAH